MSFRGRDDSSGGNPNKMDLGEPRRFGGMDGDKSMRDDPDDRVSRFDSSRGRRPPFGRGRRPSPGRDKSYGDRSRDFGYGRDEPMMRDRSPLHGSDDRYQDRYKKEDSGFPKREDHRKEPAGRPYYGDDSHRDRFMGMEGRSRHEGPGSFNSRFDGPSDQYKQRPPMNYPPPAKGFFNDGFPKPNECEIIAVNKQQRAYAESVEARVKNLGILVDVLFLKDEALLTQTIDDIARRGSLYAMVISPQNETHGSVTVNILHGTPQEHRNMPLEDALKLVSRNFHEHIRTQKENMDRERAERGPYVGVVSADREIQFLLRMLADGRWISLSEINTVIRYMCERRDKMQGAPDDRGHGRLPMPAGDLKMDTNFKPKEDTDVTKKEQDLQNRIMNIMNQGAPPPVGMGSSSTQVPSMNQGLLPNVDRSNQPGLSSGMNNMRSQPGMGSNIPGIKSGRPGLDDSSSSQPGLEPSLPVPDPSNQAAFTTTSGTTLSTDPATTPTYINFDNPRVKKALDNLMQSGPSLLKNISLSNSGVSNTQNMPAKSVSTSASGISAPSDHLGVNSQAPRGNMGPRGPGGMGDMGSGPGRNSGNLDMGPPRGSGVMGDIGGPPSQRGAGNVSDVGMGSHRGGYGGMPDMGGMNSQRGFGNMPPEGGMGSQRMPGGGMTDMGHMGPQRGGGMGPLQSQDMGRGPPHGLGPGGNFPGQNQFGKYQGPGQQGTYSGAYNSGPNMPRQNYGGPQGMGGGPRRY